MIAGFSTALTQTGERILAELLRPAIGAVLHRYLVGQSRASYDDRALVIGSNPVRVLIVGAGLAVGYGSSDVGPSLPEQLASALAAVLHRGVIVETRAQASVRLERTIDLIGMAGAATFDVVIWSPTLEETFRGGTSRWTRHLHHIVGHIKASGKSQVKIVLMGVPGAEGDHLMQRLGASLADNVNARIEGVADRFEHVEYAPVPPRRIDSWDTPLFDLDYQQSVIAGLAALLAARQREESTRARAASIAVTHHATDRLSLSGPEGL